jgi:hypothetical protein
METTVFWIAAAVIILVIDLWAIASVWRSTKAAGTKLGWAILILVFPIIGFTIWGIAGPRGIVEPPTSDEHSKG